MPLIVATRNAGKRREFEVLLGDLVPRSAFVHDLGSWEPALPEVVEDGETFEANAFKKAWEISIATGCTTLADDSGLEVDALDGAPGVYSARFAGPAADDQANNAKLVRALAATPTEQRSARYVAVLCLVVAGDDVGADLRSRAPDEVPRAAGPAPREGDWVEIDGRLVVWFRATCEGRIIDEPRGEGGFGYDPYFFVDDWGKTMAEVSLARKNERSHRARAVRKLVAALAG